MPSDWANLPHNLLDSIVERFSSSSDYLRFSLVCTSWLGVAKHNHGRFAKKLLSHPEPPMLLFFNDKEAAWNFYDVVDNKVLDVQSKMLNIRFCGSSRGWLVHVEEDFTITLTKPVFYKSNNRGKREDLVVRLPELNPPSAEVGRYEFCVEKCEYYVIKATITADPILDEDDYIVVLSYKNRYQLAFIRPSKDTTWTYLPKKVCFIGDVLQYGEDQFYATKKYGNLVSFNIFSESYSEAKFITCGSQPNSTTMRKYLLANGKDLLMIDRHSDFEGVVRIDIDRRFVLEFLVFEFNFDKCKWIEKKTLGEDVALFVGENLTISVAASNFPGCKQNCIYYNHDSDDISAGNDLLHDFGVFDMETKRSSKPYSEDLLTLLSLTNQRPIWYTPSIYL